MDGVKNHIPPTGSSAWCDPITRAKLEEDVETRLDAPAFPQALEQLAGAGFEELRWY